MLPHVLATISRHQMLSPGDRVIAAVSGGPDSVCLLHVLRELAPQVGFTLAGVAHFNHKLRGEASDQDEQFVAEMAASLCLPFHSVSAQPGEFQGNLEQAARRARRAFFGGLIESGSDLGKSAIRVALGHIKDDQAETVLFRLLRGSGPGGLAGILPVTREGLIRPLLDITRDQVLEFLKSRGLPYRTDATNLDPKFSRNRIRLGLLPQLAREWNPKIVEALSHLADVTYEEERWWTASLAGELARLGFELPVANADGSVEFLVKALAGLPVALARRLIRVLIKKVTGDLTGIDYQHVDSVLAMVRGDDGGGERKRPGHGSVVLPGVRFVRSFEWVYAAKPGDSAVIRPRAVRVPGCYPVEGGNLLIQLVRGDAGKPGEACVTLRIHSLESMELRGWLAGDRYQPVGSLRSRSLKELFQSARVPSWRRSSWPILTNNGKILWAKEFGPAIEVAAESQPNGQAVSVRVA